MIWPERETQREREESWKAGEGRQEIEREKEREGGGNVRETEEILFSGRLAVPSSRLS